MTFNIDGRFQRHSEREVWGGVPHPLIFSLSANLPNINSTRQRCADDKTR